MGLDEKRFQEIMSRIESLDINEISNFKQTAETQPTQAVAPKQMEAQPTQSPLEQARMLRKQKQSEQPTSGNSAVSEARRLREEKKTQAMEQGKKERRADLNATGALLGLKPEQLYPRSEALTQAVQANKGQKPFLGRLASNFVEPIRETFGDIKEGVQGMASDLSSRAQKFADVATKEGALAGAGELITQGAGVGLDLIGNTFSTALKVISPEDVEKGASNVMGKLSEEVLAMKDPATGKTLGEEIPVAMERYNEWAKENPAKDRAVRAGGNILATALELVGFKGVGTVAKGAITKTGKELLETGTEQLIKAGDEIILPKITKNTNPKKIVESVAPDKRQSFADSLSTSLNKVDPTAQQKFMEMSDGKSIGEYLNDIGATGTRKENIEKLLNRYKRSLNRKNSMLKKGKKKYQSEEYSEALDVLEKELGKRNKDRAKFNELKSKYQKEGLTVSEEDLVKRIYERNVSLAHKKDITKSSKAKRDATDLDNALREGTIDRAEREGISGVRELNKETQKAKFAADKIAGKKAKQAANNTLTLTDTLDMAGATTAAAVNPAFLVPYGLKKLAGVESIQSKIIRMLNKRNIKNLPDTKKLEAKQKRIQKKINESGQKTLEESKMQSE